MNKSMHITIHFLTFFSCFTSFTMENASTSLINFMLKYPDIRPKIADELSKLSKEDKDDMRLVCKEWAKKGPNWYFMPDSVEKEFDKIMAREHKFNNFDKNRILLILSHKNDLNAIQWVLTNKIKVIDLNLESPYNKDHNISINSLMIAIHNKNNEIAQLLIKADPRYTDKNWKTIYNSLTIDTYINQYLYTNNNRDFSFLIYIASIMTDDAYNFEQLYKQKKPSTMGCDYLITLCLKKNSSNCWQVLLKDKEIKKLIKDNKEHYFTIVLENHNKDIAQELINNGLYDLNKIENNKTILDIYYNDDKLKNDIERQALLEELGAKTYADLQKEKICCTIQ